MFFHNFKYSLKTLFKNKVLIFWTFAFPVIMATFFNLAFSNIEKDEKLQVFDIAVVENEDFNKDTVMQETLNVLGKEGSEDQLFNVHYGTEEESKKMLEENKVIGYLFMEETTPSIIVKQSGINETIFENVIKQVSQNKIIIQDIVENKIKEQMQQANMNIDMQSIYEEALKSLDITSKSNIEDASSSNLSYTMIEYYTLIAMACLYGAMLGMVSINNLLANMSKKGMRVSISPVSRWKMLISSSLAALITQLVGMAILFAYTIFVINVDYGSNMLLIMLLALVGCFAGLSLGVFVATVFKTSENVKVGVLISFTMLGCFLSGMMGITMKYVVDSNIPIINQLNPANMITDGFYALYYYNTLDRYWFDIISLIVFCIILIVIAAITLRRQKYDNI